jgi:hypothetical protein
MFMSSNGILEFVKSIKIKICEGYDRIPHRILEDGADHFTTPLRGLLKRIYNNNQLPEQMAYDKGISHSQERQQEQSFQLLLHLKVFLTSQVFEKLIVKRIIKVEKENEVD